MAKWKWVGADTALAIHRAQIAEHGGGQGVRDRSLLESALSGPINLAACGEPDLAALAASYVFGIARNHPFVDGNRRTAAVVSEAFVDLHVSRLDATDAEVVVAFEGLAAGEVSEDEMADWFRERIR